jgi:hypothetical protein
LIPDKFAFSRKRRRAALHQLLSNQSFPAMPFIQMDSLHNFQYSYFPAGRNQAIANGTMRLNHAGVGCIKPQDKGLYRRRWHSGQPSLVQYERLSKIQEDGPGAAVSHPRRCYWPFLLYPLKRN